MPRAPLPPPTATGATPASKAASGKAGGALPTTAESAVYATADEDDDEEDEEGAAISRNASDYRPMCSRRSTAATAVGRCEGYSRKRPTSRKPPPWQRRKASFATLFRSSSVPSRYQQPAC